MTQSDYGTGDEPLTPVERQRLRASVDVAALERWLTMSHGELRRALVAHFAIEVTDEDLIEVRREAGATDDEVSALARRDDDAGADENVVHAPPANGRPGARAFRFISSWQPIVSVIPPDDSALRALWDAIEPDGPRD